jgi:hypothetical protein
MSITKSPVPAELWVARLPQWYQGNPPERWATPASKNRLFLFVLRGIGIKLEFFDLPEGSNRIDR